MSLADRVPLEGTAERPSMSTRILAIVAATPGVSERVLKDAHPYGMVDHVLEQLHDAGQILFDTAGGVWPASYSPAPSCASALQWGRGETGGGGIEARILTQAVREKPKNAAFEIERLREKNAQLVAAQQRPANGDFRALAASFHSFPPEWLPLCPTRRGESAVNLFRTAYAPETWGPMTDAEQHVIAFLNMVWGGGVGGKRERGRWIKAPFDVYQALGSWDASNRAAFVAWCQEPWWM